MPRIVLASASAVRGAILANAGLVFDAVPASIDERGIESGLVREGATPGDVALALAEAKARAMAATDPSAYVIGADQTLDAGGERWHKPASRAEARAQILALSGRSHRLHAAVVGAHGGEVRWRHVEAAVLTMRALSPAAVDAYLDRAGEAALQSVGAYQIEGPGIQLFDAIEGDYFAILGLPLLPLLTWLHGEGALG
jgi:nucleoside triphosphate pyrophosphatase